MHHCLLILTLVISTSFAGAQGKAKKHTSKDVEFTLENIFPKKGRLFGPSARNPAWSHDGRYAVWLYRPNPERRHGNDLWMLDAKTGKVMRLTSATVMARFQASTRKVVEDRIAKAKKRKAAAKDKHRKAPERLGDQVGDDDWDDEKAPRYAGVSAFVWSPNKREFLFTSQGDVYRMRIGKDKPVLERLTCTQKSESAVAYLPDGTGYTYMLDKALMKVSFGSNLVQQLDPRLPSGETMSSYRLSPDGKKLAFTAHKGEPAPASGRKVKIARYRERFMDVREVPRRVSDDPIPAVVSIVYLYDLQGAMTEKSRPVKLFSHVASGPRDVLRVPRWSPDSTRVVFAQYDQKTGHVALLEGSFPKKVDKAKPNTDEKKSESAKSASTEKVEATSGNKKPKDDAVIEHPATVVYRWLHDGGPTTPYMMEPRYLWDSRRVVFLSEQTGFRHVHVLDPVYESQVPIAPGNFEVYPFEMSKDHKSLFALSTKEHPSRQDVYRIDLVKRDMHRLTARDGQYTSAAVSPDGSRVLANFTTYGALRELVAIDVKRHRQRPLTDSHSDKAKKLTTASPSFFEYDNRHGQRIHGLLWKPKTWRKTDKRPLLLYVYGGPLGTRKQVTAGNYGPDAYFFARYMTEKHGWVTATIDPRGMSGYGGKFEKANFGHAGRPQVEDLVDGVEYLVKHDGVDPEKVAIHGWSFGGFQTQMCMYTAPETFKVGIAGAGPTQWENYNSWYSTGTIGKSRTGKPDLEKYSLLPLAKHLKGKLLLVHGMEDSNVLYQDTVRVYRELLEAGKETLVELFVDPTGGHGLGGDVKRVNRARKYEEFLLRTLGRAKDARGDVAKTKSRLNE